MKYITVLFVTGIFVACSNSDKSKPNEIDKKTAARADSVSCKETEALPLDTIPYYSIQFRVVYSQSYCGGAYPQDEILQELHKEKPFFSSKIKMVNKDTNKEFFFVTDKNGRFSGSLHRGNYSVFLTPEFDSSLQGLFDPNCKLVLDDPMYTFSLKTNYVDKIHKRFECDPCDPGLRTLP